MNQKTWQFYNNPTEAWDVMLLDCANARHSIDLNQYIFEPDGIGKEFIGVLLAKAKQGLRVRVLCDAVGSRNLFSSAYPEIFSEAGIQIMFFNPISPWRLTNFTSWFYRDHKKILVVDSQIGHTGGLGINDQMANWRDTHVRFTGDIVKAMEQTFIKMWHIAMQGKFGSFKKLNVKSNGFSFITSSPFMRPIKSAQVIREVFIDVFRGAKHYIYLTTPYFVPDWKFFSSLRSAAKRGVDVKLIIPTSSDHKSLDLAANSYFGLAFKSGIKIYRYHGAILHTKSVIIDDEWASVGSANLDNLSFKFNYEANVVSTDRVFALELKRQFLADLKQSRELALEQWRNRSVLRKVLEVLTWPVHNYL